MEERTRRATVRSDKNCLSKRRNLVPLVYVSRYLLVSLLDSWLPCTVKMTVHYRETGQRSHSVTVGGGRRDIYKNIRWSCSRANNHRFSFLLLFRSRFSSRFCRSAEKRWLRCLWPVSGNRTCAQIVGTRRDDKRKRCWSRDFRRRRLLVIFTSFIRAIPSALSNIFFFRDTHVVGILIARYSFGNWNVTKCFGMVNMLKRLKDK